MIYATVEGGEKIVKMLRGLEAAGRKTFKGPVRAAVREQTKAMQTTAKALAPKRTRRLERAIKVKVKTAGMSITGRLAIAMGASREDTSGAWYGPFIDSGFIKGGKFHPGAHFMQKAHDAHAETAKNTVASAISAGVDATTKAG